MNIDQNSCCLQWRAYYVRFWACLLREMRSDFRAAVIAILAELITIFCEWRLGLFESKRFSQDTFIILLPHLATLVIYLTYHLLRIPVLVAKEDKTEFAARHLDDLLLFGTSIKALTGDRWREAYQNWVKRCGRALTRYGLMAQQATFDDSLTASDTELQDLDQRLANLRAIISSLGQSSD